MFHFIFFYVTNGKIKRNVEKQWASHDFVLSDVTHDTGGCFLKKFINKKCDFFSPYISACGLGSLVWMCVSGFCVEKVPADFSGKLWKYWSVSLVMLTRIKGVCKPTWIIFLFFINVSGWHIISFDIPSSKKTNQTKKLLKLFWFCVVRNDKWHHALHDTFS